MKVSNSRDHEPVKELDGVSKREIITAEDGAPLFVMRIFEVEPGKSTPSHSHPWEHEVFVLSGEGIVRGEKSEKTIGEGTVVFVESDEEHCFTNTGGDLLRMICVIPLPDTAAS